MSDLDDVGPARGATYRLLARLTLAEIDDVLAGSLAAMPVLGEAFEASGGAAAVQDLRAEFARLFLLNLHPYESVFLDDSGMLNASSSATILEHYRQHDFEPKALRTLGAPDHLGLELELMALLIEKRGAAIAVGNEALASNLEAEQQHFLEAHLARWGPIFGRLLFEQASSPLYQRLGEAIEAFLLDELQELAAAGPNQDSSESPA